MSVINSIILSLVNFKMCLQLHENFSIVNHARKIKIILMPDGLTLNLD